jgi:hypothetical protein
MTKHPALHVAPLGRNKNGPPAASSLRWRGSMSISGRSCCSRRGRGWLRISWELYGRMRAWGR